MNIRLAAGRRVVTEWRACTLALALLSALILPGPTNADVDVVITWNEIAEAVAPLFGGPQPQSRVQAIVQIAVHDALNAIKPRYARYTEIRRADRGATPDAAVAAAASRTLLELLAPLLPSQAKQDAIDLIEDAYNATVGLVPYDAATQAGIDVGAEAAQAILALREGDGSDMPHRPYTFVSEPGV